MITSTTTPAALERLEGVAGEMLELLIEDVETKQDIHIKNVDVALIPGPHGSSPAVTVIVTSEAHDRRDWAQKFGVSEERLLAAVQKVGPMAADVERELKVK